MKTRYTKVIRDLTSDYSKNSMLVVAIAIGVFGIGAILGGYSVVKREMTDNYMQAVPASATLELEGDISRELIDSIRRFPGIQVAERHATVRARMQVGGRWYPLLLFVIDDFKDKKTNLTNPISGEHVPPTGTMLVERTALVVMQAQVGDTLVIKTPHGGPHKISLSGTVHDPGLAPAWQQQSGYGYITLSTLRWLGESQGFDQIRILVSTNSLSSEHITKKAEEIAQQLTRSGYTVHEIQVPPPGKHPHQSQMSTVMSIFIMFSFLILVLGSILVATSMSTLMLKQVRQIGVMKTIGANAFQIAGLYLMMIFVLCCLALIVAIPLSQMAAAGLYHQIAALLNLDIRDERVPYWVPLIQIIAGILIPLLAASIPVVSGSRMAVKEALNHYGVSQNSLSNTTWVFRLSQLDCVSEVFRLSLRNIFRQRGRLLMTLGLLAAGGAMFMTALNVSEAWEDNLKRIYSQRLYDLEVQVNNSKGMDSVVQTIKALPGVRAVEVWGNATTSLGTGSSFEITRTYPDKGHGSFTIQALPVPTLLLHPTITAGEWLRKRASNEVVLNQLVSGSFQVGDHLSLSIGGKKSDWKVIGFTEDVGSSAIAYVSKETFSRLTHAGETSMFRISYTDRTKENVTMESRKVEKLLEQRNITVNAITSVWLLHNTVAAHMKVLVNSLMAMALLMGLVGTVGLMSTMSMSILERTREIGVMRAIGATPKKIRKLIVWEGLAIGAFSILIAVLLSAILSTYMGRVIGSMAFRTPLSLSISFVALGSWVLIIVVGSYLATLYPARRASKITTREALAYD